ncbi:hypothetical protein GALMADRAFT_152341 [Galerina marginata CBS 339.88]|uniref:Vacuolar import and degradation protein 21 n=1 Tax=Galerina marginata (strain CBS 339.88) TaxID=685588 RepID=A0A067TE68_GALM3|nr:hypothetical protein GALMADRAFT_152341 [Galerina marginata CBS 339.88]
MTQPPHDPRLQERFSQLNFIIARRNELLRELFLMMQSRQDVPVVALQDPDPERQSLQAFLRRFDLNSESGSIANLKEEELSLLDGKRQSPLHITSTDAPILVESKPDASARTPRSRSRAADFAKSPSPFLVKSHGTVSNPDSIGNIARLKEDSDEDNDELDLIRSSTFPIDGERSLPRENGPVAAVEIAVLAKTGEYLELPTSCSLSPVVPNRDLVESSGDGATLHNPMEGSATKELAGRTVQHRPSVDEEMTDEEMTDDGDVQSDTAPSSTKEGPRATVLEDLHRPIPVEGEERDVHDVPMDVEPDKAIIPEVAPDVASPPVVVKTAYIRVLLPPSIHEEILIPAPANTIKEACYDLNLDLTSESEALQPSISSVDKRHYFDPHYSIPPINLLPADFTRKARPTRRKREKERERDGKRDKDDAIPLGLSRWNANLVANPVWKKVSRASKCLSTREWGVAMTELRLIRTIERIEHLKEEGRWSFRQPKKHRVVGGSLKTHWDYLLDEIKWMRTDFREERRWKMALAYNISTAVLEWHLAKTPEERQRAGICMKWRSSRFKEDDSPLPMNLDSVTQEQERSNAQLLLGITYGSDDEDGGEQEKDRRGTIDALEPAAVIEDALEIANDNDIQPKDEDVDDQSAIDLLHRVTGDIDNILESSPVRLPESSHPNSGLKTTSNDPLLGGSKSRSQSTNGDVELPDPATAAVKLSKSFLAPLQERIAYCGDDQLFMNPDGIETSSKGGTSNNESFDSFDLRALFPGLQPLGLLDIPATPGPTDGKKRVEKRSDRDDPNKRTEDTVFTKLYPTGRFMFVKPTLIGPLQPSKRWKDGKWLPMEQLSVVPETDNSTRISEESSNDLFDGRTSASLSNFAFQLHASSFKDKESRKGGSIYTWNANDDAQLKSLVDKYSFNWPLISECFNSSRHSLLTDRRSATDCFDRWKERWGSERKTAMPEAAQASGDDVSGSANAGQMMTRGVKRLASSLPSPTTQGTSSSTEAKKRLRHVLLNESIRKAGKKRTEAAQKLLANQRKPPAIHETHNQFNKLPKLSPAELSRMKAERDLQNSQDIVLARKRQDEQIRQTLLMREQAQRGAPVIQSQVQQPQPQTQHPQQGPQQPQPPSQQVQQQQLAQQQLAQLQQLQAQQQANQTQRQNIPTTAVPSRSARLAATTNTRPVGQQAQLLQHARAMQAPVQMQTATQSNLAQSLLSQAQVVGSTVVHPSPSFYGLPPNLTQEQFLMLAMTAQQHQHQQQQQQQAQAGSNFGSQPQ